MLVVYKMIISWILFGKAFKGQLGAEQQCTGVRDLWVKDHSLFCPEVERNDARR